MCVCVCLCMRMFVLCVSARMCVSVCVYRKCVKLPKEKQSIILLNMNYIYKHIFIHIHMIFSHVFY